MPYLAEVVCSMYEWRHDRINCIVSQNFTKLNENNKLNAQHMVKGNKKIFLLFSVDMRIHFVALRQITPIQWYALSTIEIVLIAREKYNS